MRRFPALSYSGSDTDSLVLFSDRIAFTGKGLWGSCSERSRRGSCGSGCRCTMLSWKRSRGPDVAACCGGLEVRRCGNDQHGCDMADLKLDSFRRTKMTQLNHHDLSHKHDFTFVRACEQTVCTSRTLWVCIQCALADCFQMPVSHEIPKVVLHVAVHWSIYFCPHIDYFPSLPLPSQIVDTNSPLLRKNWADLQNGLFGTRVLCLTNLHWNEYFRILSSFKIPRLKAWVLLNTRWQVSLNPCTTSLAVESYSPLGW